MRAILYLPLILFVAAMFSACNGVNNHTVLKKDTMFFKEFPKERNVVFKDLFEYNKGNVMAIYTYDSILVFMNGKSGIEYYFYTYSLKNNILSNGFIKKGRGPNEALGVSSAGIYNNYFWIYDITLKKILMINKYKIFDRLNSLVCKEYSIKNNYFTSMDFIDSLRYLTVGNNKTTYKVVEKDLVSNKIIQEFGQFGYLSHKNNIATIKDAYSCYIYVKPSGDKFVLPYRYTDVVEIYNIKNNTNIAVQGPLNFNVDYEEAKRNGYFYMQKTKKTRKAFVSGTVTDNYIYLVYSGHSYNDDNWSYGRYIFVYDWNGNPIKKLKLDRYVYSIAVSSDDKKIFSFDKERGYIIFTNL